MYADAVIILARKHLGGEMESSARLCLTDAVELYDRAKAQVDPQEAFRLWDDAKARALKSLAYSVGLNHPDYRKASI